jgi:1-acyl-sn-glycerol-3-phosphate acyltransferase
VIGWFARQWGILPVYKGGNNEETVQKALRVLQRGGAIGIFPRRPAVAPVRDGHGASGRGAARGPVGREDRPVHHLRNLEGVAPPHALPHPAKIVVDFLPAIDVDNVDTRENHEKIANQVREAIVAEQLKHRVGPAPGDAYREAPDY